MGGMHRSGTTLVADLISRNSVASGLSGTGVPMDEGEHIQDVYVRAWHRTDDWAFDSRLHVTENDITPDAAMRLWMSWSPYWDLSKRLLVEKSPRNLTKTRYLQALYPGARFVVVTRHPVIQALAVRKWATGRTGRWGIGFTHLVEHWLHAHDLFMQDAAHIEHLHVIRYELLMRHPTAELGRLSAFLGVPGKPVATVQASRSSGYERTWKSGRIDLLRQVSEHVNRSPASLWATKGEFARKVSDSLLLPRYRELIRERLGDRIRQHGYDVDRLDDVTPWDPVPKERMAP
nr:sulfotransferase [Myceligenerans xiligouense]